MSPAQLMHVQYLNNGDCALMCSPKGLSVRARETKRKSGEEENLPQGRYRRAGDNMAKAARALEEHGRLPRVVWQTSADTALHCSGHTRSLWLRLTWLCTEISSSSLMHVNTVHTATPDLLRHDNTLTNPLTELLTGPQSV